MNTKIFATQDALVSALQALATSGDVLNGWAVDYGLPPFRQERHIWVDEQVTNWQQTAQTTGLLSRQETFEVEVYVYVRSSGATALEVRNEVETAGSLVEATIAATPFLGGVVMMAQTAGGEYDGAFADPEGRAREGVLHLRIDCNAFLS